MVHPIEAERERERESSRNIQRFQANQLHNLRATRQANPVAQATSGSDSVSHVKTETGRETLHPVSSVPIQSGQAPIQSATPRADELLAAQLQATINSVLKARATTGAKARAVQAALAKDKQDAPAKDAKKVPVKQEPAKNAKDTRSGPRKRPSGGRSRGSGDPSGSDPDSSSDDGYDEGYSLSDSDDSLANVLTHSTSVTTKDGKTVMNFRLYENSNSLEDFDDKASYHERTRWWERFLTLTVQGGWTDSMKVYELRLKLPTSARHWRAQLPRHVRDDWTQLSHAFKRKYFRSRMSDSERYYTIEQGRTESALDFFYRLNAVACKANVEFKKSSRTREMHIKRFIRKLTESKLRSSLKSQRLHSINDLEFILRQYEDDHQDSGRENSASRPRDFRAGNVHRDRERERFRPKGPGRAYVVQSEDESGEEDRHVRFQDEVDEHRVEVAPKHDSVPPASTRSADPDLVPPVLDEGVLRDAVFRVMTGSGRRPPPPGQQSGASRFGQPSAPQSPRRSNPDWNEFCEQCERPGHRQENCWIDIVCDRCHRRGHPMRVCKVNPCRICERFHEGPCELMKTIEALKKLAQDGALKDIPQNLLDQLLDDEANSGGAVKPLSPLGGDPVRAGLKAPELCVLAYVGPELRISHQDNQQCMISLSNDDPIQSDQIDDRSGLSRSELRAPDGPTEFRLEPGERYGWWVDHEPDKNSHELTTVHGAVNDFRLRILL
ncbi:hypothetical protein PHYSODRAFT_472956 [Phytophthora sojae]|uniref:Retrotransposon gag domain-containing protein n=1 Tax=Phytophthora sojae (strain P6497) TaxID=1094619 RepID=G4YJW4_PHYSP|nr:hypothetical protein PHYSODRAFT_472956 [Phytophthora sojae]EGZ27096.1 hypothetical protein PHYSODRAFT_472956 [Phytophthora sojae]|eukprot:XP_009514371.1 hypothetical protein PHYSODRAFT_472956 [Phytophthora sojae]